MANKDKTYTLSLTEDQVDLCAHALECLYDNLRIQDYAADSEALKVHLETIKDLNGVFKKNKA